MTRKNRLVIQIEKDKSTEFVQFLDKQVEIYGKKIKDVTPTGCYISSSNVIFDWESIDTYNEFTESLLKKLDEIGEKDVRFVVKEYDENIKSKSQEFYMGLYVPHVPRFDYSKFKQVYPAMTGSEL